MIAIATRQTARRIAANSSRCTAAFIGARFNSTVPSTATASKTEIATQQAPNRDVTWSATQRPRTDIVDDPRFIQVDLAAQPRPMAAIELISEEPVRQVETRLACCDGGGGALGHPRVWINLDEGKPESCGYCGLRFQMKPHHH